jgi:cell division protein FtsQ
LGQRTKTPLQFDKNGYIEIGAYSANKNLMVRDVADLSQEGESRISVVAPERADQSDGISARAVGLNDEKEPQFLRTEKRVPVRRNAWDKKTRSRLKIVLAIAAVVFVFGSVAGAGYRYGVHSWRFRVDSSEDIEISGVHNASHSQVMDVIGGDIGRNIFFVPLEERKKQLEQISWVESATVMRLLPNRLAIVISERTPVAFAKIGSRINLIDSGGVILGVSARRQTKYSFPIVEGIREDEPLSSRAAAMKIYSRLMGELDGEGQHYSKDLSEIDVSDPEDVKVTANGSDGAVLIHLGNSEFLTRYKLYVAHIAEWRQQFQNLQSVDLRYEGQIIVNPDVRQGINNKGSVPGSPTHPSRGGVEIPGSPTRVSRGGVVVPAKKPERERGIAVRRQ